jgi:hypothetical protein
MPRRTALLIAAAFVPVTLLAGVVGLAIAL